MSTQGEILADLLQAVIKGMHEEVRKALGDRRLAPVSLMIMHQLIHDQGITVSELARRTQLAKSHVSTTIENLARQGLVEKRPDPGDLRLVRIHSTPMADARFRQFQERLRRHWAEILAGIPDEKTQDLINSLQTLKVILDERKGSSS